MLNIPGTTEEVVNDNVILVVTTVTDDLVVEGIIMEVAASVEVEEEKDYLVRPPFVFPRIVTMFRLHLFLFHAYFLYFDNPK